MALVSATPLSALRQGSAWGMSDSSLSIDSLLLAAEDRNATPEQSRRNPFNKAIGTLRYNCCFLIIEIFWQLFEDRLHSVLYILIVRRVVRVRKILVDGAL